MGRLYVALADGSSKLGEGWWIWAAFPDFGPVRLNRIERSTPWLTGSLKATCLGLETLAGASGDGLVLISTDFSPLGELLRRRGAGAHGGDIAWLSRLWRVARRFEEVRVVLPDGETLRRVRGWDFIGSRESS